MPIALGLDPAWVTGTATTIVSAAFSPVADSLIIVESHLDGATAPTISDSVGLTWTAIGTPQSATAGGRVAAWWAYTAVARTNMTVSVAWASAATKSIKVKTWTGAATSSSVISKLQSTSAVTPLNLNVSTTNDGCRISGSALDFNARGGPTSSDSSLNYHVTNLISGIAVHKAANSSGVGTSVTLNIVKGTVAAQAADWGYKVWEIVPAAASTTPVSSDLDLRWAVSTQVNSDLDLRWAVSTQVTSDLDLRWGVLTQVTSDLDLRWVSSSSTVQVTSDLDLRWIVATRVTSDLDLRWLASTQVTSDLDLRWTSRTVTNSDLNLQWATATLVSSDLDLRWAVATRVTSNLDLRWAVLLSVTSDLDLQWVSDIPDVPLSVEYWGMKI